MRPPASRGRTKRPPGASEGLNAPAADGRSAIPGRRSAGQSLLPVGQLPVQNLALQPLPLPDRVVGVLHRQFRQRRRPPGAKGLRRASASSRMKHAQRPAIGDDVVQGQEHALLRLPQAQQGNRHSGPLARSKVCRASSRRSVAAPRASRSLGQGGQIDRNSQAELARAERPPARDPSVHGQASSAAPRGAADDFLQRTAPALGVERGRAGARRRECCRQGSGLKTGRETTAVAGRTTAGRTAAGPPCAEAAGWRSGGSGSGFAGGLDGARQAGDGGRLEQVPQGQFHAESLTHTGNHLGGQQRVAAQLEEVIAGPRFCSIPSTSAQMPARASSTGRAGPRRQGPARDGGPPGLARPCGPPCRWASEVGVSRATKAAGSICSGSDSFRKDRKSPAAGKPARPTT